MKRLMSLILICLFLTPAYALAAGTISAEATGEGINVTWDAGNISGSAVLTLYRDNWPVLIRCVDAEAGEYVIPSWCMRTPGSYQVRLKTNAFCETTEVESGNQPSAKPTDEPVGTPEAQPTATPTAAPTAAPTVAPTEVPTQEPTVKPTAKPTDAPIVKPTAVPTQAPSGSNSSDLAAQVVAQVNAERAAAGLNSLTVDADLTAAACIRAQEIVELFSHTRPDGSSWSTVSSKVNGENIAMGYRTADAVMAGWMNSEGHRENILRASFGSIGVCAYTVNGVTYWVQLFGR